MTTEKLPPPVAVALFFDDVRSEVGGKLSLMGNYVTSMALPEGAMPVDRLAVLLHVRWPPDQPQLEKCLVRIAVTGQPEIRQEFPAPAVQDTDLPRTPFAAMLLTSAIHLRFPPLRIGDAIEVWADLNGVEYPAGRLRIVAPPKADEPTN